MFDISSSKLKIRLSDVFIVNFEHTSHFFLVFILLSLSSVMFGGMCIPVTKQLLKVNAKLKSVLLYRFVSLSKYKVTGMSFYVIN